MARFCGTRKFVSTANFALSALIDGNACATLSAVAKPIPHRGIGWAIRRVRKAQQRTLEDLADAIGSDAGNLSRIERGQQEPTESGMVRIAAELNVSVSELWRLAESDDTGDSGKMLALTGQLNQDQIRRLLDYAGYLLERQSD